MEEVISEADLLFLQARSKFYLERLFEKSPIKSYNRNAILLTTIVFIFHAVVLIYTGEFIHWVTSWPFAVGIISPVLSMIFLKYLRDRTILTVLKIRPMIYAEVWRDKYLNGYFNKIFSSRFQIIPLIGAPILSLLYHYYLLYTGVWPWSFLWLIVGIIYLTFLSLVLGWLIMFCIGVSIILFNVGRHVHIKEEHIVSYDRMANLKPIGSMGLINAFTFVIPISIWLPMIVEPEFIMTIAYLTGIFLFIGGAAALFVFPIYSMHKAMLIMKNQRLTKINQKILEMREQARAGNESFEKLRFYFEIEKTILEEIKAMKVWPIDFGMILKLIGTLLVPFIPFIINLILPTIQFIPG